MIANFLFHFIFTWSRLSNLIWNQGFQKWRSLDLIVDDLLRLQMFVHANTRKFGVFDTITPNRQPFIFQHLFELAWNSLICISLLKFYFFLQYWYIWHRWISCNTYILNNLPWLWSYKNINFINSQKYIQILLVEVLYCASLLFLHSVMKSLKLFLMSVGMFSLYWYANQSSRWHWHYFQNPCFFNKNFPMLKFEMECVTTALPLFDFNFKMSTCIRFISV